MGQYFKAVNIDRQEYVCPWCIDGGAKFWEWVANPQGGILAFLLRMSDESGGGDVPRGDFQLELVCGPKPKEMHKSLMRSLADDPDRLQSNVSVIGSWVGDRIALVGDYDSTELYEHARSFRNISEQLVWEWNSFVSVPDCELRFEPCGSCPQS